MGTERPDWLPAGWKVLVTTRSCGKKDKYYVNPSGTKFNSKPEVLRHLEISKKVKKPKKKVEIKKALSLPPGWIKKYKITRKRGTIRKDPYYIDPDSGSKFRSIPDVFRYLGSMDSIKTKPKPDVKSQISVGLARPSTRAVTRMSTGKKQEGETSNFKQSEDDSPLAKLFDETEKPVNIKEKYRSLASEKVNIRVAEGRVSRSGVASREMKDTAVKNTPKQKKRKISSVMEISTPNEHPHAKGNERHEGGRRKSKRLSEIKSKDDITTNESLQSGMQSTAAKKTGEESNVPVKNGEGNEAGKESKPDEKVILPNRRKISVSRIRGSDLGVDSSLETQKSNIAPKESEPLDEPDKAGIKTYRRVKSSAKAKILPAQESTEGNQLFNEKKEPVKSPGRNLSSPKARKGAAIAVDKNKGPHEEHKDSIFTADQKEQSSKLTSGDNTECSLNSLLLDPCIEFAIKTLTGEIPITKVSNGESPVSSLTLPNQKASSSSVLPPGDISADPCFEFAIKTLTGDVAPENGSKFQISFGQPWSPLGSINGGLRLPGFTLDNYSSPKKQENRFPNALPDNFVNSSPNHGFVDGQSGGISSYRKFS